ncbi:hypothetical protein BD289DRAFT_441086 [Coniella lustricola]|uniref:Uncharacterized protein n=1 Tax=Coniella lustricola TaxID=2025994 RepID=A0A2T2ZZX1_9PEZI|nr:hypothetical protein BD289DRAFT_441086 [Coniella lustricola]
MQSKLFVISSLSILSSVVGAFSITDCGTGEYHNFGSVGSGCQASPWSIDNISFSSDKGCTLVAYSDASCAGQVWTTSSQHACNSPGFTVNGLKCT